ncbi:hypothetical protein Tco_0716331 [Tanacetum coccineum]
MQTRSSSKFVGEPSTNPTSTIPKRRNRRRSIQRVKPFSLVETPVVTMVDQRTMAELLRAPTEGYAEAIVVPPIPAEHFELKHSLINLVTSKQFFGFEKEDPHAHIRYFNKITSTLKYKDVPETSIKLMLFPFSIDGPARIWLDKEPPHSILTWDDLIASVVASAVTSAMTAMFKQHQVTPAPASVKLLRNRVYLWRCSIFTDSVLPPMETLFLCYHDNILGYVFSSRSKLIIQEIPEVEREPEVTKDTVLPSTENIQPSVVQTQIQIDEPVVAPKPKPTIPYASSANKQKLREKDDKLALKFLEIFRKLHVELSFADALLHMPKFAKMFKSLLNNKEKLFELATTTSMNAWPWRRGGKHQLDASLHMEEALTPQTYSYANDSCAWADRSTTRPAGIGEDFSGRPFLRDGRALIDVYGEELTLCHDDEAVTFKVGQTSRYFYNDAESINRIDVIDVACEGKETDAFIAIEDDSISPEINDFYYDSEGDIRLLKEFLNDDPSSPLSLQELRFVEPKTEKLFN